MIYDRVLRIYTTGDEVSPLSRRLTWRSTHYCAPVTVYHRTYFTSLQAGESVERMVEMRRDDGIQAAMYAALEDGHVYKITEAQQTTDPDGLPVTVLSLHREEARYDFVNP